MRKFSKIFKNFLEKQNFTLGRDAPRFTRILCTDAIFLIIYSTVSSVLIWINGADIISLGLNILCVFRAIISNKLSAREIENSMSIANRYKVNNYYHNKAEKLSTAVIFFILIWVGMVWESTYHPPQSDTINWFGKVTAIITIIVVICNDCEKLIIYAYDAKINRIEDII